MGESTHTATRCRHTLFTFKFANEEEAKNNPSDDVSPLATAISKALHSPLCFTLFHRERRRWQLKATFHVDTRLEDAKRAKNRGKNDYLP